MTQFLRIIGWLLALGLGAILTAFLFSGCVGPRADRPVRSDMMMPPMPPPVILGGDAAVAVDESSVGDGGNPEAAPVIPTSITIAWDYPTNELERVAHFNVYASVTPYVEDMVQVDETTSLTWTDVADKPMRFYQVTAHGTNGVESGWATK